MEKQLLSIGQMSKMNHVSISALRLYDEMGLLKPIYVDSQTNYRYYDINQNARLNMIQYMKELGMNLKEIKETLDQKDLNLIEAILIRKKEQTEKEIEDLKLKRSALKRTIYSMERYRKSPKDGTITLEYINTRRIYSMYTPINFYDYDIETYESILNDLKNTLIDHQLPQIYYCNAGTLLKKNDFIHQHYESHNIFIFVDDYFPLQKDVIQIENGMYACIYIDDFNKEKEYAKKLLEYCIEKNYTITGNCICEVLYEMNIFEEGRRSMFFRLQVPVSF
ncbi:MerR family transcriptional regulator [Floccifex porci]|uniref:MerR family transcriptional regulator n=1 Tax=Floccifex porci TaxID=2606629 RepID=A0A7X2N338_9FIRM|nr:MerR family transcriptional regulator [Floccifex porci]MSS01556.1 MerR family transcriptional regulator [Floccifex porci]